MVTASSFETRSGEVSLGVLRSFELGTCGKNLFDGILRKGRCDPAVGEEISCILQDYVILYNMARGESGRIVLEIDPSQKDDLYSALTKDGLTLKDWFLRQAAQYLRDRDQVPLFGASVVSDESTPYKAKSQPATVPPVKTKLGRAKPRSK